MNTIAETNQFIILDKYEEIQQIYGADNKMSKKNSK